MTSKTIAIIGCGAAGMSAALELIKGGAPPLQILLIDSSSQNGTGVAYSTNCPEHLLNVPADFMGIEHLHPLHFVEWLKLHPDLWKRLSPSFYSLEPENGSFLPRAIYGCYLQQCWKNMQKLAKEKQIQLTRIYEDVLSIDYKGHKQLILHTDRHHYEVSAAILAVGISWTQIHLDNRLNASNGYLEHLWPHLTSMDLAQELASKTSVGIIGSGLTMLDVLATLDAVGYQGNIAVFSRTCLLPQAHGAPHPFSPTELPSYQEFPITAREIFKLIRKRCIASKNWRGVIQGVRIIASHIWQRMPLVEKQRLMRHAFSIWNSVRHRAPRQALDLFDTLKKADRLEMIQTKVASIHPTASGKLAVQSKLGEHQFDCVINCCGPNYHVKANNSQLVRNLLHKGIVQADELGLGIAVDATCKVDTPHAHPLWVIGALTFGTFFEATAIPDIRRQAHLAATTILQ